MMFLLFVVILAVEFLWLLGVAVSIFFPEHRIWPPPSRSSWQFYLSWIATDIAMIGSAVVGAVDYESLGVGNWIRFLVGGLTILIGGGIALWGMRTLSTRQSLGLKGKLVIGGLYRYSRNPQYVGFILLYCGFILVTYSILALVTGTIVIVVFAILPFSEEPWLRQQYGEAYVKYCRQVPRFIGLRSFKEKHISLV